MRGKRKYISERLFLGLSGTAVFGIWIVIAYFGVFMAFTLCNLSLSLNAGTANAFDATYYPGFMWAGLFSALLTAFWVGAGLFGAIAVYYNLMSNNQINYVPLENIMR